jgi:DNA-binding Xre family transcriptional regulator
MLRLNLQPIFKARGIDRPHAFLVRIGLTPHSASLIISNEITVFKLKHVELICRHLNCEPNDLLLWSPDKNNPIAENHPLHNLSDKTDNATNGINTLRDIPYKELKAITLNLANRDKE